MHYFVVNVLQYTCLKISGGGDYLVAIIDIPRLTELRQVNAP